MQALSPMPSANASADDPASAPPRTGAASPARVFIGLKVAREIALELVRFAADLEQPSVRPVALGDIHLTLVPPWEEASINEAVEKLRLVASRFGPFALTFQHVGYGPQPRRPRLLWSDCAASDDIAALHAALLQAYGQADERPFRPHVTLARIRGNGFSVARRHPIDRELSLTQQVETVELFRSPPPGVRGYQVLASVRLGEPSPTGR